MTAKKTAKKATKKVTKKTTTAAKQATKKVEAKVAETESTIETLRSTFMTRIEEAQGLAKNTVLAGLGAMDRSVEEVSNMRNNLDEQIAEVTQKGTELFNELVERGLKVQADAEANLKEGRDTFEEQVNERVESLKAKVTEISDQMGVSSSLESVASTLDSVSRRFTK